MLKLIFCQTRIVNLLFKIDYLWNKHNNLYYWYQVRYIYKSKNNHTVFDFTDTVGLRENKTSNNLRELKKIPRPLHKMKSVVNLLENGKLNVEVICYLGKYKND